MAKGFRPLEGSDPFKGSHGEIEKVGEKRIEMICERWKTGEIISAAKAAHPYEEMAHFISELSNKDGLIGSGMIGKLPEPMPWSSFLDSIKPALSATILSTQLRFQKPLKPLQFVVVQALSYYETPSLKGLMFSLLQTSNTTNFLTLTARL